MAERAVFLDRDNTIIENDGYLGDPSKVKLLPGAATALSAIRALGYRLIVASNQSGVARGMFNEEAVQAVNDEMCRQLRDQGGAHIDASYYCPFHPDAPIVEYKIDHEWRKPKPGMLKQAAADFGLDLSQCWMIGDQPRDVAAGAAAGCRTILLRDPDHKPADSDPASLEVSPNFIVKTLADAARIIAREGRNQNLAATPGASPTETVPASAPATGTIRNEEPTTPQPLVSNAATPVEIQQATESVAPPAAPANLDESSLADRIAQRLSRQLAAAPAAAMSSGRIEKALEDLVAQLRHQNRNAEIPPDFSRSRAAALLVQILAIMSLASGLYDSFTAKATWNNLGDAALAITTLQHANIWLLVAVTLQGIVIALLYLSRQK